MFRQTSSVLQVERHTDATLMAKQRGAYSGGASIQWIMVAVIVTCVLIDWSVLINNLFALIGCRFECTSTWGVYITPILLRQVL